MQTSKELKFEIIKCLTLITGVFAYTLFWAEQHKNTKDELLKKKKNLICLAGIGQEF